MEQRSKINNLKARHVEIEKQNEKIKRDIQIKKESISQKKELVDKEYDKKKGSEKWEKFIKEVVKDELKSQDSRNADKDPSPAEINQILENYRLTKVKITRLEKDEEKLTKDERNLKERIDKIKDETYKQLNEKILNNSQFEKEEMNKNSGNYDASQTLKHIEQD